jgi:hypothetical protein
MTPAQLVEEFKKDPDYEVDFAASGASGGGARNGGAGSSSGNTGVITVAKGDVPAYKRALEEKAKTGKQIVFAE